MRLRIHLFGSFRVFLDDIEIDDQRWGRRKAKTLLKILALQPVRQSARQIHREELIELLWPGVDAEQGLNHLHKALHAARRALEPGLSAGSASQFLPMREQLVMLQSTAEIEVDVSRFEALADEALKTERRDVIEAALSLCEGDLLLEDLYEDWTAVRREQLRARKEQLLLCLSAVCEAEGDSGRAIDACGQLLASNSCNEAAHRCLMRVYSAAGQRYLAVEQFRTCSEALRRELDAQPEPETVALYERIVAGEEHAEPVVQDAVVEAVTEKRGIRWTRWALGAAVLACLGAVGWYLGRSEPVQVVAIMPLSSAAGSPELDYLAEGITESIINDLSQLSQVRVMARSTVYRYRAKGMDAMTAAIEMKVHSVLTGSIAKRGQNLVVAAELVAVPDGTRIWGSQYELTEKDLSSVQDRIARDIAGSLHLRLSNRDRQSLAHTHQADPEAYRLYLQARYFWNQRSKEGYLKSIDLFQAAIARDPSYAAAYAGLSDSYSFLGRDEAPTPEYIPKAKAAAERALALDNGLAEAHASLAMMSNVYDWNFAAAERGFRIALRQDPGYATGHLFYGVFLAARGEFKRSQAELDQAAELDPLSPIIALCRGYPASFQGRIEPAVRAAQQALEISPNFPSALEDLMVYRERQGRWDEAMAPAVALLHARGQHDLAAEVEAEWRRSGRPAAVKLWFQAEQKRSTKEYVSPLRIALLAVRAGDIDSAFSWLDKAVQDHNAGLVYLTVDPKYAVLRADPRFVGLTRRLRGD